MNKKLYYKIIHKITKLGKIKLVFISFFFAAIAFAAVTTYNTASRKNITPSVYYWKDNFDIDSTILTTLSENGIHKMYVKLFDVYVDYDREIVAGSSIHQVTTVHNFEIVPVVYIVNDVLNAINNSEDIVNLAIKIMKKSGCTKDLNLKKYGPNRPFKELQIDCDWTESTRDNYFALLRHIKKLNPSIILSATLRLYPYKYRTKMGIPPIDRGMLMVYNINKVTDYHVSNSIFTQENANAYLEGIKKYPLPLDVALPTFEWARIFDKKKKEFQLLETNIPVGFEPSKSYSKKISENRYLITKDTFIYMPNNYFNFEKNTEWVFDRITKEDLNYIAKITKRIAGKNASISFFELNDKFLSFNKNEINEVLENYRR